MDKKMIKTAFMATMAMVLATLMSVSLASAQTGEDVEVPPTFRASKILPPDLLKGPDYEVQEYVFNDGFFNHYQVSTTHGPLEVAGTTFLKIRLKELEAMEKMEELQLTQAYAEALKKAATGPLSLAKGVVTQPVGTVKGIAGGVGSYFKNVGHSIFGKPSEQEEGTLKTVIGFENAKRKVAYAFGVDPYSSYAPLQERMKDITWASFAGGMTVAAGFAFIPGAAGLAVSGTSMGNQASQRLRDNAPAELKALNANLLKSMGVHPSVAQIFLDNPKYSPTRTTYLVAALEAMEGVKNRMLFVQHAALAQDEQMALYFERQAELTAGYHVNVAPVDRFVQLGDIPFVVNKEGVVAGVFAFDHFAWTEGVAEQADGSAVRAMEKLSDVTGQELWLEGTASPLARKNLEARGWTVKESAGEPLALR